jgi:hypothetical protein
MENELPEGLRSDIRDDVIPILEAALKAGWYFSTIHWESTSSRTLGLQGRSPSGRAVHAICSESDFQERLKALINSQ